MEETRSFSINDAPSFELLTKVIDELSMPLVIVYHKSGADGAAPEALIYLVNREAEKLFGYNRELLKGKPIETLVPRDKQTNHPGYTAAYTLNPQLRPMGEFRDVSTERSDGRTVPIKITLNSIIVSEGNFTAALIDRKAAPVTPDDNGPAEKS
jgi:PAS domain S-box-containing protein